MLAYVPSWNSASFGQARTADSVITRMRAKVWFARLSHERLLESLAVLAKSGLFVVLAYLLADLTWILIPTPKSDGALPQPPKTTRPTAEIEMQSVASVADFHLFGQPIESAKHERPRKLPPKTKVNLVLRGIFFDEREESARAIISSPGSRDFIYAVGASLPGGVKLADIEPDRVLLLRQGRYETLPLTTERVNGVRSDARADPSGLEEVDNRNDTGMAKALGSYRKRFLENPGSVMGLLSIAPVTKDGALFGYRLQPGRESGMLQRFGLRPGDILTGVNGVSLNSTDAGLDALKQLTSAKEISLDVARGEKQLSVVFKVE